MAPAPLQSLHRYYAAIRPRPWHRYSRLAVFAACASPLPSKVWFPQFRADACVRLTPPIRRPPPAQSSGSRRARPRRQTHPWFRQHLIVNDASSKGLLSLVFRTHTCPGQCRDFSPDAHHHGSSTAAAQAGLGPAPESRSRGAVPHHPRSCTTLISRTFFFSLCLLSLQHTTRPRTSERAAFARHAICARGAMSVAARARGV